MNIGSSAQPQESQMPNRRQVVSLLQLMSSGLPMAPWLIAKAQTDEELQATAASGEQRERFVSGLPTRTIIGRLQTDRFVEPIVFLLKPFTWSKNVNSDSKFRPVTVPKGFVTDFASIPRAFYSFYRPDGEYAQAAVVHDYLYWAQIRSKEESDSIFKLAMQDLEINPRDVNILYEAVARFGRAAWDGNMALKLTGEKRILKRFPKDNQTAVRWEEWKKQPSVFL